MPRTANPEIKETLLRASLRCFARNGYQATSLDMIAREAHVTKGAIYWYYKDKAELFENVLQDRVAHLESLIGERLSEKMPPDERLQTLLQTVLDFYSENPDFASLLGILRSGPDSA
ncbi:MAG: TetR/AcrR family transcriptional regulator, partial [Armatimonadetes bacterium]|nr:TetR/AcrR family transcriptional regulator [Armatimonadota bacterium]